MSISIINNIKKKEEIKDEITKVCIKKDLTIEEEEKINNISKKLNILKISDCKRPKLKALFYAGSTCIEVYNPNYEQKQEIIEIIKKIKKKEISQNLMYLQLIIMLTNMDIDIKPQKIFEIFNEPNDLLIEISKELYAILLSIWFDNNERIKQETDLKE